ncbi:beta-galactosidase [Aureibacillus halotolerans]|uniref:Beta-galactosidase n=1 Tax=Aureibacillus halotolerans TaxID=1508390 RepID=A0A4R6U6D5_9BACI|nr:beta-galactosidase [Aureibacillus halotolerans]TDQ41152.1 beta-galactosidase-like protein [Aureibacillus halotolerans]
MKTYTIKVANLHKDIYPALPHLKGVHPDGQTLQFTNYYLEMNDAPYFGISGEFHFSRYASERWDDELLKMKMAGINTVPTYVFWNHHEECQGVFDWEGDRDLRRFITLCQKHDLYAIVRIGPFAHGEGRNGGMPDWLFGRPFDLRSNDEEYLAFARRFYQEIAKQIEGLYFKDGGPIIAAQIENEYEHSAAPWEITTGTSQEWVTGGRDGDAHIKVLRKMAEEEGIITPFYTATGWGGAAAPTSEVLPLWGGYAFWPWIFYGDVKEHPATPEFIFRDYHNKQVVPFYNFEPMYDPESVPFACCEMGGGMTVFYNYRFALPYESVDAMTLIKVAGGCNMVGYYVFHGGSNPKGTETPFLNEGATPKISYDYQAPIGEFGQLRASYHRLKRLHLFFKTFQDSFNRTKTVLPDTNQTLEPEDADTLRYAVRGDGNSGYVFINTYQDHFAMKDQSDVAIELELDQETLRLPKEGGFSLAKNTSCVLPYQLDMSGAQLRYATAQLITKMAHEGTVYYVFFAPKGMTPEYAFERKTMKNWSKSAALEDETSIVFNVEAGASQAPLHFETADGQKVALLTLTDEESLRLWEIEVDAKQHLLLCEEAVLSEQGRLRIETSADQMNLSAFPNLSLEAEEGCTTQERNGDEGVFTSYVLEGSKPRQSNVDVTKVGGAKATLDFQPDQFDGVKELLLKVNYTGDIGYAFIDGELIHDNFNNGTTWEIGLKRYEKDLINKGMYLYVSPPKEQRHVKTDSPMAARKEDVDPSLAYISSIEVVPVYEWTLSIQSNDKS